MNYPWFKDKRPWQREIKRLLANGFKMEVESLITKQRVVAVLGPVGSRMTAAAARSAGRAAVPLLSFSASEDVTNTGEQVFRFLQDI